MHNRLAIIDLGTNTFHLLIAELAGDVYTVVHRERAAVKVGMGGINEGVITAAAEERALNAVRRFREVMTDWAVEKAVAFGTSALRNAVNGSEVARAIARAGNVEVRIIDGIREAEYIFYGVRAALTLEQCSLVVDIGGGSVEFIIGDDTGIRWKQSFEIGGQRLLEKYQKHDPILAEEVTAIDQHLHTVLTPLMDALREYDPRVLAGSSGTFDTLSDIYCLQQGVSKKPEARETPLTVDGFHRIYHDLLVKDRQQRMAIPGMIEMRVDMIVVACCLVRFLLDHHPFSQIRVSSWSLKEGILAYLNTWKRLD